MSSETTDTSTQKTLVSDDSPDHNNTNNTGPSSDEHGTPRWLVRTLQRAIGDTDDETLFDLDPAAGAESSPIAHNRYTIDDNGLNQRWTGDEIDTIFLNPPYSNTKPFVKKLYKASKDDPDIVGIALVKSDTGLNWFHDYMTEAVVLCLPERLTFQGSKKEANFSNTIGVFGSPSAELLETLANEVGPIYAGVEAEAALEQQTFDELLNPQSNQSEGAKAALPISEHTTDSQQQFDYEIIAPYDVLKIDINNDSQAVAPALDSNIPSSCTVQVIPDGKRIDPQSETVTIAATGETSDGETAFVELHSTPNSMYPVEVSLSTGREWRMISPNTITKLSASNS